MTVAETGSGKSHAYAVRWIGSRDPHVQIFNGPDARKRAMQYAKERGSTATVTDLSDGTLIWRFQEERQTTP